MGQSLAREYGPKGVHVSHAIIDGVIDIPRTKGWNLGPDAKISSEAVSRPDVFLIACWAFEWRMGGFADRALLGRLRMRIGTCTRNRSRRLRGKLT